MSTIAYFSPEGNKNCGNPAGLSRRALEDLQHYHVRTDQLFPPSRPDRVVHGGDLDWFRERIDVLETALRRAQDVIAALTDHKRGARHAR